MLSLDFLGTCLRQSPSYNPINVYNAFADPVDYLRKITPALKLGGTVAIVLDDPAKSGG